MKSNKVLTDAAIKRIRPPEAGQIEHFDAALPGFAVRASATGVKSYTCHYRLHGRLRRDTLGRVGVVSLKDARDEARRRILTARGGEDPRPPKFRAEKDSVRAVIEEFIERHAKRHNRTWRETQRLFEREVLPKWGDRPLRSIARRDVIELLDEIADRPAPIMANRALAAVRKLFNWALSRDMLDASPVTKVAGPGKETRRDRVLSEDEIRAIWNAATEYPWGAFVRLLLTTGQRREEVAGISRKEIEEDVWTIPGERAKNGIKHTVPLSPLSRDILDTLPRFEGSHLLSSTGGKRSISGFSKFKKALDENSGVEGWRFHDIRRTVGLPRKNWRDF